MPKIVNDTSYYYPDSGLFEPAVSYGDGMFWRATAAGTINGTVYAIGDIVYCETTEENVAEAAVVWKVLSENTSIVGGFRIDAAGNANFGPNFKIDGPTGTVTIGGNNAANLATVAGTVSAGGAAADINANVTTIAGGKISTGNIRSTNYDAADAGEIFADAGTDINLNDGIIKSQHLVVDATGVKASSFDLYSGDTKRAEWYTALNGGTFDGIRYGTTTNDSSWSGARSTDPSELWMYSGGGGAGTSYMILDGGFSIIGNATKSATISNNGLLSITSQNNHIRLTPDSAFGVQVWGTLLLTAGSAADPSVGWDTDPNTGLYSSAADTIGFSTGGARRLQLNSSGFHMDNGWYRSVLTGNGWYNQAHGVGLYAIQSDWISTYPSTTCGLVANTVLLGDPNATTTTSGFNTVFRDTTFGTLWKYTSTRELKEEITSLDPVWVGNVLDRLRPVSFIGKHQGDGEESAESYAYRHGDIEYGFIAEEVCEIDDDTEWGAKLGQYDHSEGLFKPNGWKEGNVVSLLVAEVQALRRRVELLEQG
jgi:hypothetical protein